MKINISYILFFILLVVAGQAKAQVAVYKDSIIFQGTADAKFNGTYVHIYNRALQEKHDSVMVVNGEFTFRRLFKAPGRYMFYSSYELKMNHGYAPFGILVDGPSKIRLYADMTSLVKSKVEGSAPQDVYDHFNEGLAPAAKYTWDQLYSKYGKSYVDSDNVDTTTVKYKSLTRDYNELNARYKKALIRELEATIRGNPSSFASLYLLNDNIRDLSLQQQEEWYGILSPALKKGTENDEIASTIAGEKKSAIGRTVDNFTLNDPYDKPLHFYALKGKYVLIDFWGSWCGPCHVAFRELNVLYSTYHEKGFEILGIATERDKNAWLADIKKEKLPWLQMIDKDGNQSVSDNLFAVTEYPTTVLVDPNGKIIGRNLTPIELRKILDNR